MEKKTISARLPIATLDRLEKIQEVVKRRQEVAGFNSSIVNKTVTLEWIIDKVYQDFVEEGEFWPHEK